MYKTLSKNGQTIGFLLGAVITLLYLLIVGGGWSNFSNLGDSPDRYNTTIFNFGIFASFGLVILGILVVLFFGLTQMVSNPKGALGGILGVGALVAIFLISYTTSSGEATGPLAKSIENAGGLSSNALKLIGGGIMTSIILASVAGAAILLSELRNFFK